MKKGLLTLIALGALGAGAYLWWDSPSGPSNDAKAAAAPSADAARRTAASSVVGGAPGAAMMAPASTARLAPRKLSLSGELAVAKSYKALYDRLAHSAEGQTAEGQYVLYRMLRACATVSDRRGPAPRTAPDLTPQREFIASLPDTDPSKAKRTAALDQLGEDKCLGLTGIVTTEADLSKRLSDAVAAGSPSARVLQIEHDLWAERRAQGVRGGPTLSDGQIDGLRAAIGTADPEALVLAGRVLGSNFRDLTVRLGNDQTPVEGRALNNAFTLMACDYGYPCGDNNPRILQACAYQGHCDAGNLPDFLAYYQTSPYEQQLQTQYRTVLNSAVTTGNWSALNLSRGPTPPVPYPPSMIRR